MTEAHINEILDEALAHRQKGDVQSSLHIVQPLTKIAPRKASVAGILATLFFENEKWPQAARWFKLATKLNPKAELASLGLFHALWELGREKQAFAEMKRFVQIRRSKEYARLLRELRQPASQPASTSPRKETTPSQLSLQHRLTVNSAEREGLLWRKTKKFVPLRQLELQNV